MMRINFYNNNYNNQAPNFSGRKLGVSKPIIDSVILFQFIKCPATIVAHCVFD